MKRSIRVLGRLAILTTALFVAHRMVDPVVYRSLIGRAERMSGAPVSAEAIHASPWNGTMTVSNVQCIDPGDGKQNLFQFDSARFQFDLHAAARRRWVIDHGTIEGLRLGTPRPDAHLSLHQSSDGDTCLRAMVGQLPDRRDCDALLQQMQRASPLVIWENLESFQVAHEIAESCLSPVEAHLKRLHELGNEAQAIQETLADHRANPLRDLEGVRQAELRSANIHREMNRIRHDLTTAMERFEAGRLELRAAQERDLSRLENQSERPFPDPQLVTDYLLKARLTGALSDWIGRYQHMLDQLQTACGNAVPLCSRGQDVIFSRSPELLIRELEVHGEDFIGRKQTRFSAKVRNLATSPELLEAPVSIEMQGDEENPFHLLAVADFRGPEPEWNIRVSFPAVHLPGVVLGEPDQLAITLGECRPSLNGHFHILGNQLHGKVTFESASVPIEALDVSETIVGAELIAIINSQMPQNANFRVAATVRGSLDEPTMEIRSDFGGHVAEIVGNSFQKSVADAARHRRQDLVARFARQTDELDRDFHMKVELVQASLETEGVRIAELSRIAGSDSAGPENRMR